MIWIWLIARQSHKWATGTIDRYFAFVCAHCGVTTPAMVRTFGFGSGSSHYAAERSANAAADAFAYRATTAAACPNCCQLQPQLHQQFDYAAKKVARHAALRVPLAAGLALLVAIVLAIPAIGDIRHSFTLSAVAVSTSAAVGALFFAIFTGAVMTPSTNPNGVWFSRNPMDGPASWFPAQPGRAPVITQPSPLLRVLSLVAMGITSVSAIVALILWTETFRNVYVVSAEGPFGELSVRIDGGPPAKLTQPAGDDAPNRRFEVRTDASHKIAVLGTDGKEATYDLDPSVAKYGWVLAPHKRERGLCLTSMKMYYGYRSIPTDDGEDHLLGAGGPDLVVLPNKFDHVFESPPATVETKNGSTETRTSLRALHCASLAKEKVVPFKDAPKHADPETD